MGIIAVIKACAKSFGAEKKEQIILCWEGESGLGMALQRLTLDLGFKTPSRCLPGGGVEMAVVAEGTAQAKAQGPGNPCHRVV